MIRKLLLICFIIPLAGQADGSFQTSELDDREYRRILLDNQLEVLLISDPASDRAAASLDVAVGHGSDPDGREGLAHFLEHMLFLGTDLYPQAGEYQSFIKAHGGSHNAFTSYGHTNYFFNIQPQKLSDALKRFSRFFVAPLFNEELVKRERVIVHSEFSSRSRGEGRRTLAAERQALHPDHPRGRFAVGSLTTLADREGGNIRDELLTFYESHYSANLMKLAVLGRESLDDLEHQVRTLFTEVPNRNLPRFVAEVPLYDPSALPMLQQILPLKERRELKFTFPMPSLKSHYAEKPLSYISNILGHEGEGSLLALLKARNWASGLSAGSGSMDARQGTADVRIQLTREGARHIRDIGILLFDLISRIRNEGIESWRFREQQRLAEYSFEYREKTSAQSLVQSLTTLMQDYPWAEALSAVYLYQKFDAELIEEALAYLTPQNLVVTLISPEAEVNARTRWYKTEYSLDALPEAWLSAWREPAGSDELDLPAVNPFIPESLVLAEDSGETRPEKLIDTPKMEFWHHTDTGFGVPRANFYLTFRSPLAMDTARNAVMTGLLTRIAEERLSSWSYPAYLAGLGFEVYPHMRGLSIRIKGYTEKQPQLLERIITSLSTSGFNASRFKRLKDAMLRGYNNRKQNGPVSIAMTELQELLLEQVWTTDARIQALESVELEDLESFADAFFKNGTLLALSHGSRSKTEALEMADLLEKTLLRTVDPMDVRRGSVVKLDPGQSYLREIDYSHQDSVVALYLQGREKSREERALFFLLSQLINADFYTELRTNQKLGYTVQSSAMPLLEVPGMLFLVQSSTSGADVVEASIRTFLRGYQKKIDALQESDLDQARQSLIQRIMQRETKLDARSERYWQSLDRKEFNFDSREKMVAALNAVDLETLRERFSQLAGSEAGELVLRGSGRFDSEGINSKLASVPVSDHIEFKKDLKFF